MRALPLAVLVALCSCTLEKFDPAKVGMGVSRLTVRNAAIITAALNDDATCGFASPTVLAAGEVHGNPGETGSVTWQVKDCVLDFGALHTVDTDCTSVETRVGGKVTVSATRTVEGQLTGNAHNPVVPLKPDAAVVTHQATFDSFVVEQSSSDSSLKQIKGTFSWEAHPRLAVSLSKGVCAAHTNELGLTNIAYGPSSVFVASPGHNFEVDVDSSSLNAQLGKWGDQENALSGEIGFWGGKMTVPVAGDTGGVDPTYDAQKFIDSYACAPDLAKPISHECPSLGSQLAQGAAQLTVAAFGTIGNVLDDDTRCGFSSPAVLAAATANGPVGQVSSVTFHIDTPCVLTWATPTAGFKDCQGNERRLQGRVRVTGTRTVKGWVTGDPAQPVVPTSRDAASVVLRMEMDALTYSESYSTHALTMTSGTLSGELGSRLMLDTTVGACSIKSPIVYFRGLSWASGALVVTSDSDGYSVNVTASKLDAQAGPREDHENWLSGQLTADGTMYSIPVVGQPILDPMYDAAKFPASYTCLPHLKVPANDDECSFKQALAENAARLIVQTTGTIAEMINSDSSCGFANTLNMVMPTNVTGSPPNMGSMTFAVNNCSLHPSGNKVVDDYCTGGKRIASGQATVSGTRLVTGERNTVLGFIPSIIPRSRDAVTVELTDVSLNGFSAWSTPPGSQVPAGQLEFTSGHLLATVKPILGERKSDPGKFDIPTPVATFAGIALTAGKATLRSGAKSFSLDLSDASLTAQAGSYLGKANTVSGTVKVNGSTMTVAPIVLDPDFVQAPFDASYVCTSDLLATVPPN